MAYRIGQADKRRDLSQRIWLVQAKWSLYVTPLETSVFGLETWVSLLCHGKLKDTEVNMAWVYIWLRNYCLRNELGIDQSGLEIIFDQETIN